jgi:hypothetical protein
VSGADFTVEGEEQSKEEEKELQIERLKVAFGGIGMMERQNEV